MELEAPCDLTRFCVTFQLRFDQMKCWLFDKKEYLLSIFVSYHPPQKKIQGLTGHLLPRRMTANVVSGRMTDSRMFCLLPLTSCLYKQILCDLLVLNMVLKSIYFVYFLLYERRNKNPQMVRENSNKTMLRRRNAIYKKRLKSCFPGSVTPVTSSVK